MRPEWAPRQQRAVLALSYVLMTLSPLALLAGIHSPDPRSFAVEFSVALGFAGFALTGMQFVLPARARPMLPFGADVLLRFHRQAGVVAALVILAHVGLVMLDDPARLGLLDPLHAPARAKAGVASVAAFTALVVTSVSRRRLGLRYETWRLTHLLLGGIALGAALVHVLGVGRYLQFPSMRTHSVAVVAIGIAALAYLRLLRPRRIARRQYLLRDVRRERGNATTIELEAVGHGGHSFRPGQFAWLRPVGASYGLSENPFSFASSAAHPARPEFTIKAVGDFTRQVAGLRRGSRVLLDGPHGSYVPALPEAGYLLVVAGIGVTPAMSLLRTLADAGDARPLVLVYGNRHWEDVTYRDELVDLGRRLDLRVVHVLSQPPPGWRGERGRIDAELLDRIWPGGEPFNVFICGPRAMVDAAFRAVRRRGVPRRLVHAETFAGS